ncbi:hypothetical protein [Candidatus Palauibacter sp.]|uniref:hypothetical protein n=1 Tax=Candidatus Palauibacter sp. TaxID=3101350 RepID=UPI003C6F72ED
MTANRGIERLFASGAATLATIALAAGCAPEIVPDRAQTEGDAGENPPPASPVRRAPAAPDTETTEGGAPAAEGGNEAEVSFTMIQVRAGAEFEIELIDPIRVGEQRPGDRFRAGVIRPLIENNMVLVPLNSLVEGAITAMEISGDGGEAMVKLRFVDVLFNGRKWPISASVVAIDPAGLGAWADEAATEPILGRVIGGGRRGLVVGAAAGVAPGTAILLSAGDAAPGLEPGAILRVRLDEPFVFGIPAM